MKKVVKWYISGFYKKPKVSVISCAIFYQELTFAFGLVQKHCYIKYNLVFIQGLKKPYNPIIGETFRCMWLHQKTNSKTFYIGEQVTTALSRDINNRECFWENNVTTSSAGIPSSSSVGILCQQQEGRILPEWQHSCQV